MNATGSRVCIIPENPHAITPVRMDEETRTITLAYFEKQSTVDYIGVAQGIPMPFDAKETAGKSLPLQNIHAHQMAFMEGNFAASGDFPFFSCIFLRQMHIIFCRLKH